MSEKKFLYTLQRVCDEKVRVDIYTNGHAFLNGFIVDVGEDYVQFTYSLKKKSSTKYIKLSYIESISTKWEE